MALTDYLKLRGRTWYVRVQIPPHLWASAGGKREFVKTLKTRDLSEANRLKHAHVAAFQRRIKTFEQGQQSDPLADLYEKAIAWRDYWERHKGQVIIHDEEGEPLWTYDDEFLSQISDEAKEFLETHGEEAATSFFKIAKGEGTPLRDELIETWLAEQAGSITEQTCGHHRVAVRSFCAWAGEGVLIEEVTRKKAGDYVSRLLAPESGISAKTVKRYISSLSSLWTWLEARGHAIQGNPWLRHGIAKKSKRGQAVPRKQWTDTALVKLLSGQYTAQYTPTLHDLVRLALVTGARIDELCALETRDAHRREDGWWITIREGKTQAAVREVPIHDSAAHVIERRRKSADGFLFEGLVAGGPDKKRSWNASKAFGHYTNKLKLGEERQVFHALRNTFTEAMEAAEVPESTTKLLIGHKRGSLTYGHYSKGERVKRRKAINQLNYPPEVMRLIRGGGNLKRPQGSQRTHRRRQRQRG
jgi:integrase